MGVLKTSGLVFAIFISVALGFGSAYGWTHLPRIVAQWTLDPNDKMAYPEIYQLIKHRHCTLLKRHPNYNEAVWGRGVETFDPPAIRMIKEGVCFEHNIEFAKQYYQAKFTSDRFLPMEKQSVAYFLSRYYEDVPDEKKKHNGNDLVKFAAFHSLHYALSQSRSKIFMTRFYDRFDISAFEFYLNFYHPFLGEAERNPLYQELLKDEVLLFKAGHKKSLETLVNRHKHKYSNLFDKRNSLLFANHLYLAISSASFQNKSEERAFRLYQPELMKMAAQILQNKTFVNSLHQYYPNEIYDYEEFDLTIVEFLLMSNTIDKEAKVKILRNRIMINQMFSDELTVRLKIVDDCFRLSKMAKGCENPYLEEMLRPLLNDMTYKRLLMITHSKEIIPFLKQD